MILNDGYLLVMFDIPTKTIINRKNYRLFRTNIINNGFQMFQKSVYYKYIRELKLIDKYVELIKNEAPSNSNIKIIKMTSNQFDNIIYVGTKINNNNQLIEEY